MAYSANSSIGNPRFGELLDEVWATHLAKAAGYSGQNSPDTWANFRESQGWGVTPLTGCLVRMGDKYRRVQNLKKSPDNDRVGETIRDTLMDLASYALISICLLEEEQPLKMLQTDPPVDRVEAAFYYANQNSGDDRPPPAPHERD